MKNLYKFELIYILKSKEIRTAYVCNDVIREEFLDVKIIQNIKTIDKYISKVTQINFK